LVGASGESISPAASATEHPLTLLAALGCFASMDGTLKILGNEIVWDIVETKPEETETPKVVIN
jgi:hypothetical protein